MAGNVPGAVAPAQNNRQQRAVICESPAANDVYAGNQRNETPNPESLKKLPSIAMPKLTL